jgi:hypothetical protein
MPILIADGPPEVNPWEIRFQSMFHMANDSHLFRTAEQLEAEGWSREWYAYVREERRCLPLLEGKMIDIYNSRSGTYEGQTLAQANKRVLPDTPLSQLLDPLGVNLSHYWVEERLVREAWQGEAEWAIGWRDVGPKERTLLCAVVPCFATGDKLPLAHPGVPRSQAPCLIAALSSFVVDYLARARTDKGAMKYFIVKQLPIPAPEHFDSPCPWDSEHSTSAWIIPRVVELTYTADFLSAFGLDLGYDRAFRWDDARRETLRAELDAALFHLYGLERDEVGHVMETFGLVRASDERAYSEYRTKHLILGRFDAMQEAIDGGIPYASSLDPPPAHASVAHSAREQETKAGLPS